jgi:hypothetical protein
MMTLTRKSGYTEHDETMELIFWGLVCVTHGVDRVKNAVVVQLMHVYYGA